MVIVMILIKSIKKEWHALWNPYKESTTPKSINIKPRRLVFDDVGEYRDDMFGDVYRTTFLASIASSVGLAEEFFVHAMRRCIDSIKDEQLKKDARAFCGQEMHHKNAHDPLNQAFFEKFPWLGKENKKMEENWLDGLLGKLPNLVSISAVGSAEHFTGLMSDSFFHDPDWYVGSENSPEARLIAWHLFEELEHKSVAYDVAQYMSGNYLLRISTFLLMSFMLVGFSLLRQVKMLKQMGHFKGAEFFKTSWTLFNFHFGFGYKGRKSRLFDYGYEWSKFFIPSYRPWDEEGVNEMNYHKFKKWIEEYNNGNKDMAKVNTLECFKAEGGWT